MSRRPDPLGGVGLTSDTFPGHPLFPVDEGEPNPQVTFIQITRIDRGQQKYGPVLRADELTTYEELFEMYGGGHYELWARGPSKLKVDGYGNVTKRRRFQLPGRSKPLSKDPTPDELRELDPPRSAVSEAAAPAASSSGSAGENNFLLAMMNMQQQNAQQFAQMMQAMMQSSKQESMEMAKMQMASQQQNTTLMLTLSQQNQASMVQMMTAMMGSRGSGPDEMAKYAKLLKDLNILGGAPGGEAEGGDGEGGIGKMIEDAADAIQGLVLLKGGAKPGEGEGGASGAPAEAPAGSAAAVADAILPKI
jgi:hypothetical protein